MLLRFHTPRPALDPAPLPDEPKYTLSVPDRDTQSAWSQTGERGREVLLQLCVELQEMNWRVPSDYVRDWQRANPGKRASPWRMYVEMATLSELEYDFKRFLTKEAVVPSKEYNGPDHQGTRASIWQNTYGAEQTFNFIQKRAASLDVWQKDAGPWKGSGRDPMTNWGVVLIAPSAENRDLLSPLDPYRNPNGSKFMWSCCGQREGHPGCWAKHNALDEYDDEIVPYDVISGVRGTKGTAWMDVPYYDKLHAEIVQLRRGLGYGAGQEIPQDQIDNSPTIQRLFQLEYAYNQVQGQSHARSARDLLTEAQRVQLDAEEARLRRVEEERAQQLLQAQRRAAEERRRLASIPAWNRTAIEAAEAFKRNAGSPFPADLTADVIGFSKDAFDNFPSRSYATEFITQFNGLQTKTIARHYFTPGITVATFNDYDSHRAFILLLDVQFQKKIKNAIASERSQFVDLSNDIANATTTAQIDSLLQRVANARAVIEGATNRIVVLEKQLGFSDNIASAFDKDLDKIATWNAELQKKRNRGGGIPSKVVAFGFPLVAKPNWDAAKVAQVQTAKNALDKQRTLSRLYALDEPENWRAVSFAAQQKSTVIADTPPTDTFPLASRPINITVSKLLDRQRAIAAVYATEDATNWRAASFAALQPIVTSVAIVIPPEFPPTNYTQYLMQQQVPINLASLAAKTDLVSRARFHAAMYAELPEVSRKGPALWEAVSFSRVEL